MKVKICGLKNVADVSIAVVNQADYIGFVFANSHRQVSIQQAQELVKEIPDTIQKVGVFVNPTLTELLTTIRAVSLDVVQLHGEESLELIQQIPVTVIKAFPIKEGRLPEGLEKYPADVIFLFDAPAGEFEGGSGRKFDWHQADFSSLGSRQFFVAGGLTSQNVQDAISYFDPYGVDVSSGVETNREKDPQKIKKFIETAKGVN